MKMKKNENENTLLHGDVHDIDNYIETNFI